MFWKFTVSLLLWFSPVPAQEGPETGLGTFTYDQFTEDAACASCHVDIARQHEQALMSQCFTHPWDEIEYFSLALPHSERVEKVAGVKAGCNGCHAPLAFLAGDIPPSRPEENTRANESVSCDVCHSITGFTGDVPFNGNYTMNPGETVQGTRSDVTSPVHGIKANPFLKTTEFCGTCHNEKDPWGVWVKSTQLEWKEGPYAAAGIVCQDCHMPPAAGNNAAGMGEDRPDVRQHLFHGAHDPGKLRGAVEVRIHPEATRLSAGDDLNLQVTVLNAKAGHMIPSGSAEERMVWLHVEAIDAFGEKYPLPVEPKGFEGEEYTIADSTALAYQDIGEIQQIAGFPGLKRDAGIPEGDRIFRLPYFDEQGRMTIAQWNTARLGTDYRLGPLEAVNESFHWKIPSNLPHGRLEVVAQVWYSRLVPSVAAFLDVPAKEVQPVLMNEHRTSVEIARSE